MPHGTDQAAASGQPDGAAQSLALQARIAQAIDAAQVPDAAVMHALVETLARELVESARDPGHLARGLMMLAETLNDAVTERWMAKKGLRA